MIISAIYATSENGVIGNGNKLPWHIPKDLKHFKEITLNKTIIMGRKTFESIGKPLPNRQNIVISNNNEWSHPNVKVFTSVEDALSFLKNEEEVFVIGGSSLFNYFFKNNYISYIYLTIVKSFIEGDVIFTLPNEDRWVINKSDLTITDNGYDISFIELKLKE